LSKYLKFFGRTIWLEFFERDEANFAAIASAYGEKFNEVAAKKAAKAPTEKTLDSLKRKALPLHLCGGRAF
jgi:hypothetical protein